MKKLNLSFENVDGNAFAVIGYFVKEAKKAEWTKEEINKVVEEATSKNYDYLLQTILKYN